MGLFHVVLLKFKPGVTAEQIEEMKSETLGINGKIPGLKEMYMGPPLEITVHRAQGYSMALIAILEKPEDLPGYSNHPEHTKLIRFREAYCENTIAYDMAY